MKTAVMQPYWFPYLGYFQLIHAVDNFVIFDDVNYINRGWINRNNILMNQEAHLLTLNLEGASQNKLINEINVGENREKLLRTLQQNYSKSPSYKSAYPVLAEIISYPEVNLAKYLEFGLQTLCDYMNLHPRWHLASEFKLARDLKGKERVMSICKELMTTQYINLPGGRELYSHDDFERAGLQLSFIQPNLPEYSQFGKSFIPNLSIIDVLMFNTQAECRKLVSTYNLD